SQLVNRPALGVHPTPQFIKQIEQTLFPVILIFIFYF
ncbi:unnamed protein product, partial [Rotaria sp. Silwood1]